MITFLENLLLLIANRIRNDGKSCGHIFHRKAYNRYLIYNDKLKRVEEILILKLGNITLESKMYTT